MRSLIRAASIGKPWSTLRITSSNEEGSSRANLPSSRLKKPLPWSDPMSASGLRPRPSISTSKFSRPDIGRPLAGNSAVTSALVNLTRLRTVSSSPSRTNARRPETWPPAMSAPKPSKTMSDGPKFSTPRRFAATRCGVTVVRADATLRRLRRRAREGDGPTAWTPGARHLPGPPRRAGEGDTIVRALAGHADGRGDRGRNVHGAERDVAIEAQRWRQADDEAARNVALSDRAPDLVECDCAVGIVHARSQLHRQRAVLREAHIRLCNRKDEIRGWRLALRRL